MKERPNSAIRLRAILDCLWRIEARAKAQLRGPPQTCRPISKAAHQISCVPIFRICRDPAPDEQGLELFDEAIAHRALTKLRSHRKRNESLA
jgi:hypothetical protein